MHNETIIIGAGPIGIELAANLKNNGRDFLLIDGGQIGQTIMNWPRNTPFFSSPERVAIAGVPLQSVHQSMLTGEEYLAYLRRAVEQYELQPLLYHKVVNAQKRGQLFHLDVMHRGKTSHYTADRLILAHGNMHSPRRLAISGEDLDFVDHYYDDLHRYFRQKLLIVGGRNSAVEAAIRAWRAGADVTLMHRCAELKREKLNSRYHLEISILLDKGRVSIIPDAELSSISQEQIQYMQAGTVKSGQWDFVLLCTGFEKDLSLLHQLGVDLNDDREPLIQPDTMESLSVPGLHFAGTAVSGGRDSYSQFIGTSHEHVEKIMKAIAGDQAHVVTGDYVKRSYPFSRRDIESVEGKADK